MLLFVVQFVLFYTGVFKDMGITENVGNHSSVHDGFSALMFSLSSLTMMGFGDYSPLSKFEEVVAYSEALFGYIILSLLITIMPIFFKSVGNGEGV